MVDKVRVVVGSRLLWPLLVRTRLLRLGLMLAGIVLVFLGVVGARILECFLVVRVSEHSSTSLVESGQNPLFVIVHLFAEIVLNLLPELLCPAVDMVAGS